MSPLTCLAVPPRCSLPCVYMCALPLPSNECVITRCNTHLCLAMCKQSPCLCTSVRVYRCENAQAGVSVRVLHPVICFFFCSERDCPASAPGGFSTGNGYEREKRREKAVKKNKRRSSSEVRCGSHRRLHLRGASQSVCLGNGTCAEAPIAVPRTTGNWPKNGGRKWGHLG